MRTFLRTLHLVSTATLLLACQGSNSDLSREVVTTIPAGTATGNGLSGSYRIVRRTTACSGTCAVMIGGITASVCDVGDDTTDNVTIAQNNGVLNLEVADTPGSYRGGVDSDGSFDVGAYETQNGNTFEIVVRVEGTLTTQTITGTARSHSFGTSNGTRVDCFGEYSVTGTRN